MMVQEKLDLMKKVITYGTYDLLHQGHINLLKRAKALGDYLIVGVTNDNFDRDRGKLNVRNNVLERVEAVKATGIADQIIIEDYVGQKIDDVQKYNVDIFAIPSLKSDAPLTDAPRTAPTPAETGAIAFPTPVILSPAVLKADEIFLDIVSAFFDVLSI
jgi:cytidyltransferase-like protein